MGTPLDPAQLQQPGGDGRAQRPVQVRAALRPVQAGAREPAPRGPHIRHIHAERSQRGLPRRGDLERCRAGVRLRRGASCSVADEDAAREQGIEQRHPGLAGQVVVAGTGLR